MTSLDEARIIAADDLRWRAIIGADLQALDVLLHEDFTYTHNTGRIDTRESYLARMGSGVAKYLSEKRSEVSVKIYGHVGLLRSKVVFEQDVSPGPFRRVVESYSLGVWVDSAAGLQIAAYASTLTPTAPTRK